MTHALCAPGLWARYIDGWDDAGLGWNGQADRRAAGKAVAGKQREEGCDGGEHWCHVRTVSLSAPQDGDSEGRDVAVRQQERCSLRLGRSPTRRC